MPKIRFRSLPTGVISVAVSQSTSTIQAKFGQEESIPDTGTPATGTTLYAGTAAIEVNRDRGTSPAGFFFSIKTEGFRLSNDTPFDPYSDLHYRWCFSDPGWYTRHDSEDLPWGRWYDVAGEHVLFNDGTVPKGDGDVTFLGNDKDIAYGPHVCHVFAPADKDFEEETPDGTVQAGFKRFTVTCEIRNRWTDEVIEVKRDVLVDNPNAIFARGATYCISKDGPHGDEPIGSVWCATLAEAAVKSTGPNRRYLLRRGEEHEKIDKLGGSIDRCFLGSYGSATQPAYVPVISDVGEIVQAWNSGSEVAVYGIDFVGAYDPSRPYETSEQPPRGFVVRSGTYKTFWDTKITGTYSGITTKANGGNANISLGNFYTGNYFDYGIFLHPGIKAFGAAGVFSKQHPYPVVGTSKWPSSAPFTVNHAPFRASELGGPVALNLCDLRSVGGWGGSLFQPSLRLGHKTNAARYIEEAVIDRLRAEGGDAIGGGVGFASDPSHSKYVGPALPRKYIYDKVYSVSPQVQSNSEMMVLGVTGSIIRNCILVSPHMPVVNRSPFDFPNSFRSFEKWWGFPLSSSDQYDPSFTAAGLQIFNNSFIEMRPAHAQTSEGYFSRPPSIFGQVHVDNNIFSWTAGAASHEDASDTSDLGRGNYCYVAGASNGDWIDLRPLWNPTIPGFLHLAEYDKGHSLNEDLAIPVDATPIFRPSQMSPFAEGSDTSGRTAVDDFFGRVRGKTPSKGAVEPL